MVRRGFGGHFASPTAPADVAEMLMGIREEAECEINDEATKRKNKIKSTGSVLRCWRGGLRIILRWSGFKEDRLDERISEMQQQLERD